MHVYSLARKGIDLSASGGRDAIVNEWLGLSASSLAAGRFLERPTLESIRALLLLALHYVVLGPGDSGGAGIAYLTLAMQSCVQVRDFQLVEAAPQLTSARPTQLRLHRDPDRYPGRFGPGESEDRRRLFCKLSGDFSENNVSQAIL